MSKYIKIYIWQFISILVNFASVFVVTPYISSNVELYGIYSVVVAAYLFISYADFGFLSAGMKYAAESYARKNIEEEIRVLGFSGMVFLVFGSLYALGILVIAFDPSLLISNLTNVQDVQFAKKLLLILAFSCPLLVIQRIIQIIFAIRLQDYKYQRVTIGTNTLRLLSVFVFFELGDYLLVEYFLFAQFCTLLAVIIGLLMTKYSFKYPLVTFFKSFRFSKSIYHKTKKLAFTSIFLTLSWILYYELDPFVIAKVLGAESVAIYAIGLSIITYFRAVFGIFFTPFIARFNHFVGLNDMDGLKRIFVDVLVLFLPVTVFSVLIIHLTMDNFVLSWVGEEYKDSIAIAKILVLSYIFSFITYPAGILIMATEKVKLLYISGTIQPVIFWVGVALTLGLVGLKSFAYFKVLAFLIETIFYSYIILKFLELRPVSLLKKLFVPSILSLSVVLLTVFLIKDIMPVSMSKVNLMLYFAWLLVPMLAGFVAYYFSSKVFRDYFKRLLHSVLPKLSTAQ